MGDLVFGFPQKNINPVSGGSASQLHSVFGTAVCCLYGSSAAFFAGKSRAAILIPVDAHAENA
ncbi:MAG TPA: hypothetical protein VKZ53_10245 [Candidatus Angelobacter sp.]|nr:hypothetical protein [Candidatus Angelobacter sp.]